MKIQPTITLKQNGEEIEVLNPLYQPLDKLYMHTMNNFPAIFDGDQICSSYPRIKLSEMATSLSQIRRERKKHLKYRKDIFNDTGHQHIDHIIINLK